MTPNYTNEIPSAFNIVRDHFRNIGANWYHESTHPYRDGLQVSIHAEDKKYRFYFNAFTHTDNPNMSLRVALQDESRRISFSMEHVESIVELSEAGRMALELGDYWGRNLLAAEEADLQDAFNRSMGYEQPEPREKVAELDEILSVKNAKLFTKFLIKAFRVGRTLRKIYGIPMFNFRGMYAYYRALFSGEGLDAAASAMYGTYGVDWKRVNWHLQRQMFPEIQELVESINGRQITWEEFVEYTDLQAA